MNEEVRLLLIQALALLETMGEIKNDDDHALYCAAYDHVQRAFQICNGNPEPLKMSPRTMETLAKWHAANAIVNTKFGG